MQLGLSLKQHRSQAVMSTATACQQAMTSTSEPEKSASAVRRALPALKFLAVCMLILLLGIPTMIVGFLSSDRQSSARQAAGAISSQWGGGRQILSGPYLIVPVMGPTNLRDGSGKIVDLFMRPASWFLGFGTISLVTGTSEGIVILESHHRDFQELERSSVDFYPVLRSAYYQNRMGEIWDRRQHRRVDRD